MIKYQLDPQRNTISIWQPDADGGWKLVAQVTQPKTVSELCLALGLTPLNTQRMLKERLND